VRDGHLDAAPDRLAAVILAGGRARRLGGRDKPMVAVGGVPMLGRVIDAVAAAGAAPVVVVGPVREGLPAGVLHAREEPAGGGPAAAAAAGLVRLGVGAEIVALLAADLPQLTGEAVRLLVGAIGGADGAVFVDGDGRRQLLCGVWRTPALVGAVRALGELEGASLRRLVAGLEVREVRWSGARAPYFDCDTEDDLRRTEDELRVAQGPRSAEDESRGAQGLRRTEDDRRGAQGSRKSGKGGVG
jgi:molybdopterin-guanine dinucleotide biosynthesis protein A